MHDSDATHDAPLLQLEQVSVPLGGRDIIVGLDLEVRAGERVALLGANGAGKSTLLRAACGIAPASEGRILLAGEPLAALSH
ncbi:MAG: branched-chain amino acid transporter ATP-binding protein, partial [Thermoleophilia bacterium]|nr:branched-chain amino acid transporter ATP-binding protein [Thermoleophilia bacterium]